MRRRSPASATRHAAEPGLGEGLLTGVELSTARNLVGWRPHDGHPAVVALDAVEREGAIDGTIALQRATNAAMAVHTATKAEQSRFSISISRAGRWEGRIAPPVDCDSVRYEGLEFEASKIFALVREHCVSFASGREQRSVSSGLTQFSIFGFRRASEKGTERRN